MSQSTHSLVEQTVLNRTGRQARYAPTEKIRTLVVDCFPELGKLTALRFLEWAQQNEGWTVSLPTGKTPEHFIKWVGHLLHNWHLPETRRLLEDYGIDPGRKPAMDRFHFIQIDEFYPIDSRQLNSFFHYVNTYYIQGFGFDPNKALLIDPNAIGLFGNETLADIWPHHKVDLSLRTRLPANTLEDRQKRVLDAVDQFCTGYEERIRAWGGVGFFLGGIGPDGHIGFNVRGSDHFCTTRLCPTNYETQAAAAGDLGGMEVSRDRLVITIGLDTIAQNPASTAIMMAAGEAKAAIVRDAVETAPCNRVPATALHKLNNAAFYLTKGAAKLLTERQRIDLSDQKVWSEETEARIITDVALARNRPLDQLTLADLNTTPSGALAAKRLGTRFDTVRDRVIATYKQRLQEAKKLPKNQTFLHTAPHHDDIMLGYLPHLLDIMGESSNQHTFNYLTSGFNAVTNSLMSERNLWAHRLLPKLPTVDPTDKEARNREVFAFLDALAAANNAKAQDAVASRYLACVAAIWDETDPVTLSTRMTKLGVYFASTYPGKKDDPPVQKLKGMMREWEADVLWGHFGFRNDSVIHSRLGFYQGDMFTEEPELARDVLPVLETMRQVQPTIVTVALDPEGSGPDTHYKVLQAVTAALKQYVEETGRHNLRVWGYRNVWYRFHPATANRMAPIDHAGLATLHHVFMQSFASQAKASFPSYAYDGPFSLLARQIQVNQYEQLRTLLGDDQFLANNDRRMRSARAFVFLKDMDLDSFYATSRILAASTERANGSFSFPK